MKLLLIEDDLQIGDGLKLGLSAAGFQVEWVTHGHGALAALAQTTHDLMVLDLGLPDIDGMDVLKQSQHPAKRPPTLILSARHLTSDRVQGLNLGADDFLVKPFDFDELVARLHALHRRAQGRHDPLVHVSDLCIDPLCRTVRLHGQPVALSPREFDVLLALAERPGVVRSAAWVENRLYPWEKNVASNAIQVHLHHLRKKLGEGWIHNIRGIGYKLQAPASPTATPSP